MDRQEALDGLELDQSFLLDDEVGPVAAVEASGFVEHGNRDLAGESDAAIMKFKGQAGFIGSSSPGPTVLCTSMAQPMTLLTSALGRASMSWARASRRPVSRQSPARCVEEFAILQPV